MTTLVLFEIRVQDTNLDATYDTVRAVLAQTREFSGARSIDLWIDSSDPTSLTVVEEWESVAAHDAYVAWRAGEGRPHELIALLAAPPVTRVFTQDWAA